MYVLVRLLIYKNFFNIFFVFYIFILGLFRIFVLWNFFINVGIICDVFKLKLLYGL